MDSLHNTSIELNNRAATLIQNNSYVAAISSLTTALQWTQQRFESFDTVNPPMQGLSLNECMTSAHSDEMTTPDANRQTSKQMYQRPIHVPKCWRQSESHESNLIISAVIMFNLGLSHHLEAVETQRKCKTSITSLLSKAAKLYELAYNMQRDENIPCSSVLFSMAIINNLGVVYLALGHEDMAQECFEHLLSSLMYVVDCGEGQVVSKLGGDLFFRTTLHLVTRSGVSAAAA